MSSFLKPNFLLQSNLAEKLYFDNVSDLPIIDYHNHLPVDQIADNINFDNITQAWLYGDHYKWRASRTLGVAEKFITGDASDEEKFYKWAEVVPATIRNPLFHWTQMELKNPFNINTLLNKETANHIYQETGAILKQKDFSTRGLLTHFKVEMLGTTDDPIDDLKYHQRLKNDLNFKTQVLPSFRPDKVFKLNSGDDFRNYISKLGNAAGVAINDLPSLIAALKLRVAYFNNLGCVASDHGLSALPAKNKHSIDKIDKVLQAVLNGNDEHDSTFESDYTFVVLASLSRMYFECGWVQQFHLGALRNTNASKLLKLGGDTGFDSIGDFKQAETLSGFLNHLENDDQLPKTIIYNLNPADNAVFASMIGNYQQEGIKGKIQFGSAWWFLDQLDGMEQQINTLSSLGLISCFVGMLTDSRSFLSFSRHEYFRRLLCNIFANDVEKGYLPLDEQLIGGVISDISYYNAKSYFNI